MWTFNELVAEVGRQPQCSASMRCAAWTALGHKDLTPEAESGW